MFIFSLINYHRLLEWVHWIYGFCLVSLVAVLVVGTKVLGAGAGSSFRAAFIFSHRSG